MKKKLLTIVIITFIMEIILITSFYYIFPPKQIISNCEDGNGAVIIGQKCIYNVYTNLEFDKVFMPLFFLTILIINGYMFLWFIISMVDNKTHNVPSASKVNNLSREDAK